jgi:ABC-type multidrug transport system fused ATPase/permease subunit
MCCKIKLNKNWFKILQVFFAITMSAVGVSQSTSRSADLTKVKIAVNSIFEIIDLKSKIDPLEKSGKTMKAVKGEVELQHISFTYPTRPTMPIFKDLNLIVQAGTVSNLLHLTRKKEKVVDFFFCLQILSLSKSHHLKIKKL